MLKSNLINLLGTFAVLAVSFLLLARAGSAAKVKANPPGAVRAAARPDAAVVIPSYPADAVVIEALPAE
ncbi:MAG TPA: hypothetical protein VMW93_08005 [bacterium]|nr:hypothetical protein [bacterium]